MKFSGRQFNALILLTVFLSGVGCSGPGPARSGTEASPASASAKDSVLPVYASTPSSNASAGASSPNTPARTTAQPKTTKKEDYESTVPDLKTVLNDYYKDCRDTVRADTQILYKGQPLHIRFQHYSTNDSLVHLPLEYCKLWGLKKFTASNFESHLWVSRQNSTLVDTIIRNSIFDSYVRGDLIDYGVLFPPSLNWMPDRLRIDYSYSIPLTDVGIPVHLEYLYSGKLETKDEYH